MEGKNFIARNLRKYLNEQLESDFIMKIKHLSNFKDYLTKNKTGDIDSDYESQWNLTFVNNHTKDIEFINPLIIRSGSLDSNIISKKVMFAYQLFMIEFAIENNIEEIRPMRLIDISETSFIESSWPNIIKAYFDYFRNTRLKLNEKQLNILTEIDKELRSVCVGKFREYVQNNNNIGSNGGPLYWSPEIIAKNSGFKNEIDIILEKYSKFFEPKYKNELEKARTLNDKDKYKVLKAIYDEVPPEELDEAIRLVDEHNSKIKNSDSMMVFAKTGSEQNYYTLFLVNTKGAFFKQNVSVDFLVGVKKVLNHYPNMLVDVNPNTVKKKNSSKMNGANNPTITFGKYNGLDVLSLWEKDKNYALWLLKELSNKPNITNTQLLIVKLLDQLNKEG